MNGIIKQIIRQRKAKKAIKEFEQNILAKPSSNIIMSPATIQIRHNGRLFHVLK